MSNRYNYVSIDRIFSKLLRDYGDQFNEGDVIEWCGEALEFIGAPQYYEEAVAFIEVKNHQCKLSSGTHAIIQIARNHNWTGSKDDKFCPSTVISELITSPFIQTSDSCANCGDTPVNPVTVLPDYIVLDCNGQPINEYDIAYYRPYFDLKHEYLNWRNSNFYKNSYTPVRLATHSFSDNLVCTTDDVYNESNDEYTVVRKEMLRFSFKEGSVAVALTRQVVDPETGYPLIPDNISYTTAITKYIIYMMACRDSYSNREGSKGNVDKLEKDWHWYCKQAGNIDMMPNGIDEYQNLLDQRSYILPRNGRYYGFFGKMARPENRKWNDPDNRNRKVNYFTGN